MKVAEVCALRWRDVRIARNEIRVMGGRGARTRSVVLPRDLLPVLREGTARCRGDDYVFRGKWREGHLGPRMAQLIVRRAAREAGIVKPVTCMTLRHTFAALALEDGWSVRRVQEALGHRSVKTTMRYYRCMLPPGAVSPLDLLEAGTVDGPDGHREAGRARPAGAAARATEPQAQEGVLPAALFAQPLSVAAVDPPYAPIQGWRSGEQARRFHLALKTQLRGGYPAAHRPGRLDTG